MSDKKPFYITTTIPYVNAEPHVGFALEIVQADTIARYKRLMGHEVFFNTGTDEHGQKIWEKAQETGEDVQAYVDGHADSVKQLKTLLNLSNDGFVRTTDAEHKAAAQHIWKLCEENDDIYKKKYKGLYCVGCEKFLHERDLEDGKCPLHPGQEPVELEEENYFFKFSKYEKQLLEYLNQPGVIVPEHRRKEAVQFVEKGLEDVSISREKEKLPWGVSVPGDDDQVMYVWFDALTNYISTLGWPNDTNGSYKKFWEEGTTMQVAGKDMIRFQSLLWQAMLRSAKLSTTDQIFYHGFINSGGQRMSKSLGNVISPKDMVEKYGVDATRYILLRHIHPTDDTDVTWEKMDEWYNANLANGLGNLTARILKMSETHLDAGVDSEISPSGLDDNLTKFDFQEATNSIWQKIGRLDEIIAEKEPFKLIKTDEDAAKEIISDLVIELHKIAVLLKPFMSDTSEKILEAIKANKKPDTLFQRID